MAIAAARKRALTRKIASMLTVVMSSEETLEGEIIVDVLHNNKGEILVRTVDKNDLLKFREFGISNRPPLTFNIVISQERGRQL